LQARSLSIFINRLARQPWAYAKEAHMQRMRLNLALIFAVVTTACVAANDPADVGTVTGALNSHASARAVCPGPSAAGDARCHAWAGTDANGKPLVTATYTNGFNPGDLQSAYALPSATAGVGKTVAIVDAYDYPTAEADLAVYRDQFGLPPCTTANGCFKKVNQNGVQGSYPKADSGWSLEMALDLDMVSAACPNCKILLVEAKTASIVNLGTAVNKAVAMGATAVSNSYGAGEYFGETSAESSYYKHPGVAITVSSGDSGYGVEFPAASQYVTAVGGTTLARASNPRGWVETTWGGSGSGCSKYIGKPSWQKDPSCSKRTVADVSAVADPATGVAVYDSTSYQGQKGWWVVGGTSASSPLISASYALAGNAASITYGAYPYSHTTALNDVTSGSNGTCSVAYLCSAVTGYDGPTGLGTPNGIAGL
jgi:subtilase family serine protease